jgi:pimeloyl-ACP methyl ester carboxylesterase
MYYRVNDINLFVDDEGAGEVALVFLHFYGGSSNTWEEVTDLLLDEFRCIRYDHRGWGQSDKPAGGYSIRELAADALALIEVLNLERYVLVGHSMGGKIAQYIASQRPPGLEKLVLVAPAPAFPTIVPPEQQQAMESAYTSLAGINATIDEVFGARDLESWPRSQLVWDMQSHCEQSRLAWPRVAMKEDVSTDLDKIDVRTLIIAGEQDTVESPQRLNCEVLEQIRGAKMVIIPAVGHLSMLQAPGAVADYIGNFGTTR